MRSVFMSLLLIVAVILLYEATIGGEAGASNLVHERGQRVHLEVGGIEP